MVVVLPAAVMDIHLRRKLPPEPGKSLQFGLRDVLLPRVAQHEDVEVSAGALTPECMAHAGQRSEDARPRLSRNHR